MAESGGEQRAYAAVHTPALSLVVCTVGRVEPLARLLDSLLAQTRRDFEVLLVDQNPPGTLDELVARVAGKLDIKHLRSERGLSRARNVGLAAVNGEIVCFPDDDCWYPTELVAEVVARFEREGELELIMGQGLAAWLGW